MYRNHDETLAPKHVAVGTYYESSYDLVYRTLMGAFFGALQPSAGYDLLSTRFLVTHDEPQSVGHLWTSDHHIAETST
jgi:hypothetical protein